LPHVPILSRVAIPMIRGWGLHGLKKRNFLIGHGVRNNAFDLIFHYADLIKPGTMKNDHTSLYFEGLQFHGSGAGAGMA